MEITNKAKNKIAELLKKFPANTYFVIHVTGQTLDGFNYSCFFDTSRSLNQNVPDAQVYISVDPYVTCNYNSYPALFEKIFDYDEVTDEFIISPNKAP